MKKKTVTFLSIISILSFITLQPVFGETDQPQAESTSTISDSTTPTPAEQPKASATSGFDQSYRSTENGSELVPQDRVSTKSNFLDAPLMDIVWCGEKKNVIFMLTEKNTLYRSQDDGFTGHLVDEHLHKLGKAELIEAGEEVGQVSMIMQSPVDKDLLLIVGTHGINWVTENCGSSFRAMNQGRHVEEFQLHPTERTWLLASAWTRCDDFEEGPCKNYKELFVSKDLGSTWDFVANYVFQSSWGMIDKSFINTPKERVIISYSPKAKGNQTLSDSETCVSYSDDFFKTAISLVENSDKFLLSENFLFIVQGTSKEGLTLYSADARQKDYILREIQTPSSQILDRSYIMLDSSEHSVFLHIDHAGSKARRGHIYVSDSAGVKFTRALQHNVRDKNGQCDFEKVEGLEGIYLANVYEEEAVKRSLKSASDEESSIQAESGKKLNKKIVLDDFKQTKISFDKGAQWQYLTPPKKDMFNKDIICPPEEECHLHLNSASSPSFGPFYSTANSIGIIIATGNVGEYLTNRPDEVNTYLSRDAGLSWFEIAKGSHMYEIGDHGGLIVIAPTQNATKDVYYSWDEGISWEALRVSDTLVHVTNIIIEPSNTGEKFLVYGKEANGQRGVIAALDFSSLHQRTCVLPDKPGTPESDYEIWTPNRANSPVCLLGRQNTYLRRKREAKCFNNEDYDEWLSSSPCDCTEEDWECDFGYARQGKGPCVAINDQFANQSMVPPEECFDFYYVTQGYRKVGGNTCKGGVNHDPIEMRCPGFGVITSRHFSGFFFLLAIVAVFVWLHNPKNTEMVKGFFDRLKKLRHKPLSKKNPEKEGYTKHSPTNVAEEEHTFTSFSFEDDSVDEPDYAIKLDTGAHKRMTERNAMEAARRHVPLLNRPESKKWIDDIRGC